jgi:DNA-binding transcriptional MerR regulator
MGSNPYVGPRAFQVGEKLNGRDRELRDLLDLLIAERVVLLYSPSGAGKTSLVQAGLVPKLREEKFMPLPVTRVSLLPRHLPPGTNRYILSVLLSLEEHQADADAGARTPEECVNEFAGVTLSDYLDRCRMTHAAKQGEDASAGAEEVLIFDQFEEILTLDPTDREAKMEFFTQVGAALRDRQRWALFSMREEYRAALDPFLRLIPTGLSATFRLDLLEAAAARQAIQQPARDAGVVFTDEAAQKLVDDLRRVRVSNANADAEETLGQYVEPVQLQVVCRNLWEKLPPDTKQIDSSQIETVGQVNVALGNYYAASVSEAAKSGVHESVVRRWIGTTLITESNIRGQVLAEESESAGLNDAALKPLLNAYVVRAEQRRGVKWLELAHDRLIKPIQENNQKWFATHLSHLQQQAALWDEKGRPDALLLRDPLILKDAEDWAKAHPAEMESLEHTFLSASRKHRRYRYFKAATVLLVLALIVSIGVVWKVWQQYQEIDEKRKKVEELNIAIQAQQEEVETQIQNLKQRNQELTVSLEKLQQTIPPQYAAQVERITKSLNANNEVAAVALKTYSSPPSAVTIRYFQKDVEKSSIYNALKALNLDVDVQAATEGMAGVPTNCIWYGSQVSFEVVKQIAEILINANIRIKAIRPSTLPSNASVIQVGSSRESDSKTPLTVEQIRTCTGDCKEL